jgi:hypothetical protein
VTDQDHGQLEDSEPATSLPQTGNATVDDALLRLTDLSSLPLAEHHDRLTRAHEALHEALDRGEDDRSDEPMSS